MARHSMLRRGLAGPQAMDGEPAGDGGKYVNDPIHGYIELNQDMLQIIDTPQFQRLRGLKQMGTSYFVFPGASHNRFEHCVGTAFLAGEVVQGLAQRQPELEISGRDVRCVTLAGLCHDLGHGPFSHLFDNKFIPRARPGTQWSHEMGSEMMLHHLVDENHIDIGEADLGLIKKLIRGARHDSPAVEEKQFLFDIVANNRNGVDVDKFDYIQRDCYNVGVKSSYDFSRLMLNSHVIDDELCYNNKEAFNLAEMFHTRYSLHKRVYSHRTSKAIEYMVVDAMLIADPVMDLSGSITDPRRFQLLTDDILRDIERSTEPELEGARDLLRRIHKRDLYKHVDDFILPPDLASVVDRTAINPAEIVGCRAANDDFEERDVLVDFGRIHFGMGTKNPVDCVQFYSKFKPTEKFAIPSGHISLCVPEKFEERIVCIFTRNPSKRYQVQRAARRLIERFNGEAVTSTPHQTPPSITPNRGLTLPHSGDEGYVVRKRQRLQFSR
ncbi:hypothetical protein GGF46_004917 [Coemansia sp. RSA 552]|nr:hypothetical protein GGF46_004917 [Coemansia sp. RSA 552]